MLEGIELVHASMELVRINLRTRNVSRTPVSAGNLHFGVINPGCVRNTIVSYTDSSLYRFFL